MAAICGGDIVNIVVCGALVDIRQASGVLIDVAATGARWHGSSSS